ncbi:hypothetical protein [Secundilactobacillus oryzae]|nr:hypothetical protein [Secundilactobacillus oryzae]
MKLFRGITTALIALVSLSAVSTSAQASTYTQKSHALSPYTASKWKTVANANNYVTKPSYVANPYNYFQTSATQLTYARGNQRASFKTNIFLPAVLHSNSPADWGNPQSIALTSGGGTAYVMYAAASNAKTGWVAKYNLSKLRNTYKVSSSRMDLLRHAFYVLMQGGDTSEYKAVRKCVTYGSRFTTGHGQSLAMNPKNGQLWFVQNPGTSGGTATVQRLSKTTLRPYQTVKFKPRSSDGHKVTMGSNLTFDKAGHAYFSSFVAGSKKLKIYKGTISSKHVKFALVMQGLKYRPGTVNQSISYNSHSNRLYFISDESISSVPVSKLGKLKPSDVKATAFNGHREFEGLAFTSSGTPYLLLNRSAEIMKGSGIQ